MLGSHPAALQKGQKHREAIVPTLTASKIYSKSKKSNLYPSLQEFEDSIGYREGSNVKTHGFQAG